MNATAFGVPATGLPAGSVLMEKGKYAIYILGLGIAIAVIVLIADNFFHFLPVNPVSGPSRAARSVKTFWTQLSGDAENLVVPANQSPTRLPSSYAMSFQMIIVDSRAPNLGVYRHVVHRGANPCGISASTAGPSGQAGIQVSDLPPNSDPTYTKNGLPSLMNPGLMLDAYKNDLHVFVHTKGSNIESGLPELWLESLTVEDLPMNTPITIGVIQNERLLEVYVNCKLYGSLMLRGHPYLPAADNQWFGRYCAAPFTGLVKNLQLWPGAINSRDFIEMCRVGNFSSDTLPTPCSMSSTGSVCPSGSQTAS